MLQAQNKEGIHSTSIDTNVTQLTALSKAEVYIFRGRGVFIDVVSPLADINLWRTYRAIDSVATGRIPSSFCATRQ